MDRKEFLKSCGFACAGGGVMAVLLQSCGASKTITGTIKKDSLLVAVTDFETRAAKNTYFKKYIILNNDTLKYPICLYRFDAQNYAALWLSCPHQGAELQVFGDKLQCPAHGSEFDNKGVLTNGPADKNLRSFPVTVEGNMLKISLKK